MLPTAKEFLPETEIWDLTTVEKERVYCAMIAFAKLHCIEQIIVISNKAKTKYSPFVDLTAYPLDNIK